MKDQQCATTSDHALGWDDARLGLWMSVVGASLCWLLLG
jgi:hypothetical protein